VHGCDELICAVPSKPTALSGNRKEPRARLDVSRTSPAICEFWTGKDENLLASRR